jgi:hypothetical protein
MLLAVTLLAAPSSASFDCYVRVAQPHDQPEAGRIGLMYVTYELMLGSASPGIEIRHTCSPGPVAVDHGGGYEGVENRNGANLSGYTVSTENVPDSLWKGSKNAPFIDTMTVTLDVRKAADSLAAVLARKPAASAPMYQGEFDETVRCTIECILDNATRSFPPIHHIRLRIRGPKKFNDAAKVYRITSAPRSD